jgi:hypothetical protein
MHRLGDYELEAEVGRGGMGRVYRARHARTGAVHAVKTLESGDPEALARFRREAAALARVAGDGIVAIHESGQQGHTLWYAMDLMPGGSLRGRIAKGTRLEWREACSIVLALSRALGRCHGLGLVHRDLKPENVLFDEEERPWIADFGCVRDLGASQLTKTGAVLGTPGYMAPEQLDGSPADARADVFALGVILYELLAGERPFPGERLWDLLKAIHAGAYTKASKVAASPRALDHLLDSVLAKEPGKRPKDAAELAAAIEAVLEGGRRSVLLPAFLALAGLAVVGGAVLARVFPLHSSAAPAVGAVTTAAPEPKAPPVPAGPSPDHLRREAMLGAAGKLAAAIEKHVSDPLLLLYSGTEDPPLPAEDASLLEELEKEGRGEPPGAWEAALAPVASASRNVLRQLHEPGFQSSNGRTARRLVVLMLRRLASRSARIDGLRAGIELSELGGDHPPDELLDDAARLSPAVADEDPVLALHLLSYAYKWKSPEATAGMFERARHLRGLPRSDQDAAWDTRAWVDAIEVAVIRAGDPDERLRLREEVYGVALDLYRGTRDEDNALHYQTIGLVIAFVLAPNARAFPDTVRAHLDDPALPEGLRRLANACERVRAGDEQAARDDLEAARRYAMSLDGNRRREVLTSIDAIARELKAK